MIWTDKELLEKLENLLNTAPRYTGNLQSQITELNNKLDDLLEIIIDHLKKE